MYKLPKYKFMYKLTKYKFTLSLINITNKKFKSKNFYLLLNKSIYLPPKSQELEASNRSKDEFAP